MPANKATPVKVGISDKFIQALTNLPKNAQKKTIEFVSKFRQNPRSPGINYESIKGAKDAQYRSVRIDQNYRGIVRSSDIENVYLLLWVDSHDNAYSWARRHKCSIHPETGTLQIYESTDSPAPEPVTPPQPIAAPEQLPEARPEPELESEVLVKPSDWLFSITQEQMNSIGVPSEMVSVVSELKSADDLEAIEKKLPTEAFEALYLLAAGTGWAEIEKDYIDTQPQEIDVDDIDKALERASSKRSFWVIDDEMELQQVLNAPLDRWRVFLHPSQRKLIDRNWNGPVRVLGGAGTGKTVVALHRARWLVKNVIGADEKVLFTTFTANLALDIKTNLGKICSEEEIKKIEIIHIDGWVGNFLKRQKYPQNIVYSQDERMAGIWDKAFAISSDFAESFYKEEWERVILPQRIQSVDEYKRAKRAGRGVALSRKQRIDIWPVFEEVRAQMHRAGLRTFEDATLDAVELVKDNSTSLPYRSVIVDESQDMGTHALTLLRALVPKNPDDMFLVGDGHQRIYRRQAVMGKCGIKIVGRGRKLKINYRTTEETRRFASAVLKGFQIDDLDGGIDTDSDYVSLTHGTEPLLHQFKNAEEESAGMVKIVKGLIDDGIDPRDICITYRINRLEDQFRLALQEAGIDCHVIRRSADDRSYPGVRLATMHRVKGLEFRHVIIGSVNAKYIPLEAAIPDTEDLVEVHLTDLSERSLFHVAATRAVVGLHLIWHGEPSPFIQRNQ